MPDIKVYAVAGRPVLHSLSPRLFNFWFRASGLNAVYTRLAAGSAEDAIRTARAIRLEGLNITSPFKEDVVDHLDGTDAPARKIGAINCVVRRRARLWGYNMDHFGAVRALIQSGIDPEGKSCAVLGAGGAARAAAYGLLRRGATRVTILNRTEESARSAARAIGCGFAPIRSAEAVIRKSEILVSCVPARAIPLEPYLRNKKLIVLQADYRQSLPVAERALRTRRTIDGREWLIGQAILSFRHFTGRGLSTRLINEARAMDLSLGEPHKSNIALVGFMGSGKTAVGRALARRMGLDFADTDAEIERRSGITVPQIFKTKGEPRFRALEKSLIAEIVPAARNKIFSLGGGALLDKDTRALLARHCHVIWLWTSLETALGRIDPASRPVLQAAGGEPAIARAYRARFNACARTAGLIVDTSGPSPDETAERIRYEMDRTLEG
jgi:shikimate dehydrogenase